jgi:putative ATPase
MDCLPKSLIGKTYYNPGVKGNEIKFKERLDKIKEWKKVHKELEKNGKTSN